MIPHECKQNSEEWRGLRAGMPTGSAFGKLITSTGAVSKSLPEYAFELAIDMKAGKPVDSFGGNKWTERGHEFEPIARADYEFNNDCEVELVGFITDDLKRYGASPDGLVNDDGMVEIKCLSTKEHLKVLIAHKKTGKTPPKYVPQTQGELLVAERKWNDLFFFHPYFASLTIRIEPIPEIARALKMQLAEVIKQRDEILKTIQEF
jgi:hypothetical protein